MILLLGFDVVSQCFSVMDFCVCLMREVFNHKHNVTNKGLEHKSVTFFSWKYKFALCCPFYLALN